MLKILQIQLIRILIIIRYQTHPLRKAGGGDSDVDLIENNSSNTDEIPSTGGFTVTGGTYGVDYEYETVTIQIQEYDGNSRMDAQYPHRNYITSGNDDITNCHPYPLTIDNITPFKISNPIDISYPALVIKTNTSLEISTNGNVTSDCIYINPGVQANVTFNNVKINGRFPVNIATNKIDGDYASDQDTYDQSGNTIEGNPYKYIKNNSPTSLNLTLAKGSDNELVTLSSTDVNNRKYQFPAIRCGEGSKLTIDDERLNIDKDGNAVLPELGRVSRDATLLDGTVVKQGDRLTKLDSDNPGKLTARGGLHSAAIGGSPMENSGEITINGGNIETVPFKADTPYDQNPVSLNNIYSSGAGIGGGHGGGGTNITINGGDIDAKGSFHGAGIGGGSTYIWSFDIYPTYALTDTIINSYLLSPLAGDININGGYVKATGYQHGNAFGEGCACSNKGRKITITGGTLLPERISPQISTFDIGGNGGDVFVLGGSVRISGTNAYQSSSNDGSAWGDENKSTKVYMCTIDLNGYGSKGINVNRTRIDNMTMSAQGQIKDYGLPSYTDENGKLYFWLPNNTAGQEIRTKLSASQAIADSQGNTTYKSIDNLDEFTIENVTSDGRSVLKQWSHFDTSNESKDNLTDKVSAQNKGLLTKKYDGNSLLTDTQIPTLLEDIFKDPGIAVSNPANSTLTYNKKYFEPVTAEKVNNKGETIENTEIKSVSEQSGVGKYRLLISSTQYGNTNPFNSSFWGHRGYVNAEITPANSKTTTEYSRAENKEESDQEITFTTKVRPADGEAKTCESPRGTVNYYLVEIDPQTSNEKKIKIAENVKLTQVADDKLDGFNYSTATYTWKPTDTNFTRDPNKTYAIQAEYVPGSDPSDASNAINYKDSSVTITPNIKIEPINQNFVVDEKTSETARIINADDNNAERSFTFGDHGEDGTNSTLQLIPSNTDGDTTLPNSGNKFTFTSDNDDIASVDSDGNVTFKKAGTVTFTITQPGNGAYNDISKKVTYNVNSKQITDYSKLNFTKRAERMTGSGSFKIGDKIAYTITVNNPVPGTSGSVYVKDPLPQGLRIADSAIQITHPDKTIETKAVSSIYDPSSRNISLQFDNVSYGETYTIRIETVIEQTTYHDDNGNLQHYDFKNTAYAGPQPDMNDYPLKAGPVGPGSSVNSNGDSLGPVVIEKGCEEDVDDGYLLYVMRVWNWDVVDWNDVSFRDVLPEEITLVEDSLTVQEPGSPEIKLDTSKYYNSETRTIDYPIGVLHPNDMYIIRFKCNVATKELEEKNETKEDISNVGTLVTGNGGQLSTAPVHIGETKSTAGSPSGMSLSKDASYDKNVPDEITYTLRLKNNSGENTRNAEITDALPEPLTLKSGSASVIKPDGTVETLNDQNIYNSYTRTVSYKIPEEVKPGESYTLTFKAMINGTEKVSDIQNTGSASGTWSGGNGNSTWNISTGGVITGGSNNNGSNNGGNNNDGSGAKGSATYNYGNSGMYIKKTVENHSHGTSGLHTGDELGYRIETGNNGNAENKDTIITDYLPIGLNVDYNSLQLIVPDSNGRERSISPLTKVNALENTVGTYTVQTGTTKRNGENIPVNIMKVYAGTLKPGEAAYLYFNGIVTDQVSDIGNSAGIGDKETTVPVYPLDPDKKTPDPQEDTPVLQKKAEVKRQAIEYAVHIKNPTRRSTWRNVQLFDYLPPQLDIVENSIHITKYENGVQTADFVPPVSTYNEKTHMLSYPIDRLRPGEEYVLNYQAVAKGGNKVQPIENHAGYTGDDGNGKKYSGTTTNAVPDIYTSSGSRGNRKATGFFTANTGDSFTGMLWISLLLISAGVMIAILSIKKKEAKEN